MKQYYYLRRVGNVIVVVYVCLSVSILCKNFLTDLHEIFREGWRWANEQTIEFWCRSGSPSGYRDSFPDSSLLGDTESASSDLFILICQIAAVVIIKLETRAGRYRKIRQRPTDITTLVRRALAEVCTVLVLLVSFMFSWKCLSLELWICTWKQKSLSK